MNSPSESCADEADRMARLRELGVLDSAPEPVLDSIARLASDVCHVPIALISLIDADRQWFKANIGLPDITEISRDAARRQASDIGGARSKARSAPRSAARAVASY